MPNPRILPRNILLKPGRRRTIWRRVALVVLPATLGVATTALLCQTTPASIAGTYNGMLGTLPIEIHMTATRLGKLSCTLDSPSQHAFGVLCANVELAGENLTFQVPSIHGMWTGTVDKNHALTGMWSQGTAMPLTLTPGAFHAAAEPSGVDGEWAGTLHAGTQTLPIRLTVRSDRTGKEFCSLDSPDQHAYGLPCENVVFHNGTFSFDVALVHGSWSGALSENGRMLVGTWNQGKPLPLDLRKQGSAAKGSRK